MEIIYLVVILFIGAIVGLVISFVPMLACYYLVCNKYPWMHTASKTWGLIGLSVWLTFYPLYFAFDKTHDFLIFAEGGGESGIIVGGMLYVLGFCTSTGFILSGIVISKIYQKKWGNNSQG